MKSHNYTKHDGKKFNYKSAVSRNISSMLCLPVIQSSKKFPSSSTNLSSDHNIQFEDEELEDSLYPPSKVSRVSAEVGSGNDASLVELSDKVSELSSQVKNLISAVSQSKKQEIIRNNNNSSDSLGDEDKHLLIKHALGLNSMIRWLDDWLLVEGGLKCIACTKVISYEYDAEGREFDDEDKLPQSFKNTKVSVLRHIESANHLHCHSLLKNAREKEKATIENAKQCGLNCAAVAYTTLHL